ncbi:unnamed protein product, partial [Meganyctiphanes norvegica]
MREGRLGVDVIINNISGNPYCPHGPTILFEKFQASKQSRQYFSCSACRDRKDCSFFFWADQKISSTKMQDWKNIYNEARPNLCHREIYTESDILFDLGESHLCYCKSCCRLFNKDVDSKLHKMCDIISGISEQQLKYPSTFLPPKDSSKCEAQYLFTSSSIEIILNMLKGLCASNILCVGAPRIHEAITNNQDLSMNSLMLDIDERYCTFFPPEKFVSYNMFNHHFFDTDSKNVYKKFISQENLVIVSDPPFGGRVELLHHNFLAIQTDWQKEHGINRTLPMLFIFPYFMEPQILSFMPGFTMLDYQVDYDNHPLYSSGTKGMKNGSAVRVFVNKPAELFPLPESDYNFCEPCNKWVNNTNKHCEKCKGCMSKDGRTYKHCDTCVRCVKPSWKHCQQCTQCKPQDHKCGTINPGVNSCHRCGQSGHKRKDCQNKPKVLKNKRKFTVNEKNIEHKKKKIKSLPQSAEDEQR